MQENPYSALLGTLRQDSNERATPSWCLGLVRSVEPLVIHTGEIELRGDDLLVNIQLLQNPEKVTLSRLAGTLLGSVDCPKGEIGSMAVSDGVLEAQGLFAGVLAVDDQVAMLRDAAAQQFIVLCKVVSVEG